MSTQTHTQHEITGLNLYSKNPDVIYVLTGKVTEIIMQFVTSV